MYDPAQLKSGLIGLVGWRQNYDPAGVQLSGLTTSTSGLYFNDEHPLLNIENLLSVAPEFSKLPAIPEWDSGTDYIIGDLVSLSGTNYIATAASTNQAPPDADYWEVYDAFTYWLKKKTEAGVVRAIQAWVNLKIERKTARNLLERNLLFETAGRMANKDANEGKIVCIEVAPRKSRGLQFKIERVGLQLDTNQAVTVYLFNSESATPEQSLAINYTASGGIQWADADWTLNGRGAYYIAYDQAGLSGQSINAVYDYSMPGGQGAYFPAGRWYTATAGKVTDAGATVAVLWDISQMSYTSGTNYGLHLDINAGCDYTPLILEQKALFAEAISKQVAIDLLKEIAFNPTSRVNRHEANIDRATLIFEIEGDSQGRPGGMRKQLVDAIEAIQFDATGIDRECLPCRKTEVQWTVV